MTAPAANAPASPAPVTIVAVPSDQERLAAGASPMAITPDWSREAKGWFEWNPGKSLLASIRSYQRWAARGMIGAPMRMMAALRHRFWSVVTGADIPPNTRIGGGLLIPHPNGIVIHSDSIIGPNCLLFQQVTLGATNAGVPCLLGHVDVGAGARIIGPVMVGDDVLIGANAVVTRNVPTGATAVGIPARIVGPKANNPA